jgi:hypothetical protein
VAGIQLKILQLPQVKHLGTRASCDVDESYHRLVKQTYKSTAGTAATLTKNYVLMNAAELANRVL